MRLSQPGGGPVLSYIVTPVAISRIGCGAGAAEGILPGDEVVLVPERTAYRRFAPLGVTAASSG